MVFFHHPSSLCHPSLGKPGARKENINGNKLLLFWRYYNLGVANTTSGDKIAPKLEGCSHNCNTGNLSGYDIVNWRLAGFKQHTRIYRSVAINVITKYYHLVVSRAILNLSFRMGYYLPGSYAFVGPMMIIWEDISKNRWILNWSF